MPSRKQSQLVAYQYLVTSGVLWGLVALFYKQGLAALSISLFLVLRFSVGAIGIYVSQRHRFKKLSIRILGLLTAFALIDAVAINYIYSFAIQRTSLLHASIILLATPFFVYFFAALLLKERPHKIVLIGSIVAATGLALIVLFGANQSAGAAQTAVGDSVMLLYAIVNAFTIVLGRKLLSKKKQLAPEQLAFIEYAVAAMVIGLVLTVLGGWSELATITIPTWGWVVAAGIIGGALPILLYYKSVKRLPAERLADITFISPAVAGVVGVVFLGEALSSIFVIGTTLVVVGLLIGHDKIHPVVTAHKLGTDLATIGSIFKVPKKAYEYISAETRKFGL